jgi:hypothetical protein
MPLIASNANIDFEAYEDLYKMKTFIGDSLEPMSAESLSFEPLDYDLSLQRSKASEIFNLHRPMLEEHNVSFKYVQDLLTSFKTETLMESDINEQLFEILSNIPYDI